MVPHFKRLSDFMLARKWYMRALYMPGSERSDSKLSLRLCRRIGGRAPARQLRMRRHKRNPPEISSLQMYMQPSHKTHIRSTSGTHEPT